MVEMETREDVVTRYAKYHEEGWGWEEVGCRRGGAGKRWDVGGVGLGKGGAGYHSSVYFNCRVFRDPQDLMVLLVSAETMETMDPPALEDHLDLP